MKLDSVGPVHNLQSTRSTLCKHHKNREKLNQEHLIGCRGVKLFLQKDVTITTVTTAPVTTVTITSVTI